MKNTGCAVKSMVIGSTAVVINIFLNAALIYGLLFFPEMGIAGAALATSISKLIEMGWAYLESLREKRARLRIKYCFTTEKNLARDYWKYTMPMLGDYLVSVSYTHLDVYKRQFEDDSLTMEEEVRKAFSDILQMKEEMERLVAVMDGEDGRCV